MKKSSIGRCVLQKSKKIVFLGASSSGMKPNVMERSIPQGYLSVKSKTKMPKGKEIVYDADMDENDVILVDMKVESNKKRKGASSVISSRRPKQMVSVDLVRPLNKGKDYIDLCAEDEYSILQSHFDKIDLPPGIEAPIRWLLDSVEMKNNMACTTGPSHVKPNSSSMDIPTLHTRMGSTSHKQKDEYSILQSHFDKINLPSGSEAPFPWLLDSIQMKNKMASATGFVRSTGRTHVRRNLSSVDRPTMHTRLVSADHKHKVKPLPFRSSAHPAQGTKKSAVPGPSTHSRLKATQTHAMKVPSDRTPHKAWRRHMSSVSGGSSSHKTYDQLGGTKVPGTEPYLDHSSSTLVGIGTSSLSQLPSDAVNPLAVDPQVRLGNDNDDVLRKYENFKKFDIVEDHSDHHFSTHPSATTQAIPPKNWAKRIQEEWRILEKDLPDTIFVRVYESRMDLLRAVIIGAEGTPYHDGLFFFDVYFPSNYPNEPPLVHYHSGGLRINPNLYNCGKVCLSLLNTWNGGRKEKWIAGASTMLQVLVSIQGLILNAKPYFNEPGFEVSSGTVDGENRSLQYNEKTLILSLKTMVYTMKKPPKHFEDLVIRHFRHHARDVLLACKAYTEGAPVGCLVRGIVQGIKEGDKGCSPEFVNNVASYIKILVDAFKQMGAQDAEEFLSLSPKMRSEELPSLSQKIRSFFGIFGI